MEKLKRFIRKSKTKRASELSKLPWKTTFLFHCHQTHLQVDYFVYCCPSVLGFLSAAMKEQWLLSNICPLTSIPPPLPSSSIALSEFRFPTTGFEVGGELIIM